MVGLDGLRRLFLPGWFNDYVLERQKRLMKVSFLLTSVPSGALLSRACAHNTIYLVFGITVYAAVSSLAPEKYSNNGFSGIYMTLKSLSHQRKESTHQIFCPILNSTEAPCCGRLGTSHQAGAAASLVQLFNTNPYSTPNCLKPEAWFFSGTASDSAWCSWDQRASTAWHLQVSKAR